MIEKVDRFFRKLFHQRKDTVRQIYLEPRTFDKKEIYRKEIDKSTMEATFKRMSQFLF